MSGLNSLNREFQTQRLKKCERLVSRCTGYYYYLLLLFVRAAHIQKADGSACVLFLESTAPNDSVHNTEYLIVHALGTYCLQELPDVCKRRRWSLDPYFTARRKAEP